MATVCKTHKKGIQKAKIFYHCGCWEYQIGAICANCRDQFVLHTIKTPFRRTFCSAKCKNKFHSNTPEMRAYKAAWERENRQRFKLIKETRSEPKS